MAEKKPEHNPSPHATATHAGAPMTYAQAQTFPAKSIVRVPQDEEPSVTWQPLERETATAEPPLTTAGQMNEPVRKPTAPFTSEVYEKTEPNTETNPPGKDGVHNQDGKKRPSDRNL
jgi:hypothetical protein